MVTRRFPSPSSNHVVIRSRSATVLSHDERRAYSQIALTGV
jgi:hypothetical protein